MKILYCAYRDWAKSILNAVSIKLPNISFDLVENKEQLIKHYYEKTYDLIFVIGWSWIIPKHIINNTPCICLHPSKLPKYRGGSPLQHQIINGETTSAVSLFLMTETLDAGPLVRQEDFSLAGSLEEIFNRIEQVGINEILSIIHEYMQTKIISTKTQDDNQSTTFKRRTPEMSEIKIEDFRNMTAQQLYNKIRALQFPYPRPYILCKDNTKLYLNETDTNE